MKTVELFAGIGGFRLAADRAGCETVWANDYCPNACTVYQDCFGSVGFHAGDFSACGHSIPEHDLLTAGFPCQPFSSAGKKEGLRDPRGTLFQGIVEVLRVRRPAHFILENVKRLLAMERGAHFATVLASLTDLGYGVEWRLLNTKHFALPQNRERVFLLGSASPPHDSPVAQVRLAALEDFGPLAHLAGEELFDPTLWKPIARQCGRFPTWGVASRDRFFAADLPDFSLATPAVTLASILQANVPAAFDLTHATREWVGENTPVNRFINGVEIISNQRGGARMGYTIFGTRGLAPTLTSTTSRHYERYRVGDRYRRLTNVEYARIQGFPDDHCRAVPLSDQYVLLGNAVPPPMAGWVIRRLAMPGIRPADLPRSKGPRTLFDHVHQRNTPTDRAG